MPTIAPERQIYADLLVGRPDGVTWESLREYLASATVELGDISGIGTGQSGVDGVVRRASFVLRNDRAGMPGDSFSPRDRQSAWNQWNGDYAPLLWPNREVILRVRIDGPVGQGTTAVVDDLGMADGATSAFSLSARPVAEGSETVTFKLPYRWTDYAGKTWSELTDRTWVDIKEEQGLARDVDYTIDYEAGTIAFATTPEAGVFIEAEYGYWATLFHGLLGDAIRTSGPTVECDARDLAKRLQDTYILTPREYGSEAGTPAETVIQQIIDDNLGAGEVTLYFPSGTASDPRPIAESPGFMVTPYVVEYMSVWDAIQQVAAQFGWFLGYRWHPNTGRMQLILMEPPRNKDASTADFHFSWEDDIYTQDLEITDRDIRNIVTVTFRNSATGDRESVTVQDDTSIATYGPRAMQIEEGDASLIDTPEEAERLANAALADLKDMTATTRLNLPLLPTLDVFSGIVVTDPRLSSTDDFYGVESVRHVLDFEARQFRTEVVASGRVIGGHHRWLRMQTRPGAKPPVRGTEIAPQSVDRDRARPGDFLRIHETGTVNMVRGPVTDGRYMQRVEITGQSGTNDLILEQTGVPISPTTTYTAHVAVRASVGDKVYLEILERDDNGVVVATHVSDKAIDTQDLQLLWVSFVSSSMASKLDFRVRGLDSIGEFMFVESAQVNVGGLVENFTTGPENLLTNPSFEIDNNTDGLADNWNVVGSGLTWSTTLVDNSIHWGTGFSVQRIPLAVPLEAKPVVLGLFLGNNDPLVGKALPTYYTFQVSWTPSRSMNLATSFGVWVAADETDVYIFNGFSFPVTVRYYVMKEEAFA